MHFNITAPLLSQLINIKQIKKHLSLEQFALIKFFAPNNDSNRINLTQAVGPVPPAARNSLLCRKLLKPNFRGKNRL